MSRHIGILGGGIIGSATAYELAKQGVRVTVFDAAGDAPQATPGSLGWINAHTPRQEDYFRLRVESIEMWRALVADHPALPVRFEGTYDWDLDPDVIEATAAKFTKLGHPARLITRAELETTAPFLSDPPQIALDLPNEGLAIPGEIAAAFRRLARHHSAEFHATKITKIDSKNGQITKIHHSDGETRLDGLVVAAGALSADMLAPLGIKIPMKRAPGMLVTTKPLAFLTAKVIAAPGIHFWQSETGSVLMGADFGGGGTGQDVAEDLCLRLQDLSGLRERPDIHAISVADRPIPEDGLPILDRAPDHQNLWFGVMHSGVTLAPAAAHRLAGMVMGHGARNSAPSFQLARFS